MRFLGGKGGYFEKLSKGSKTSDMTWEGLGEVFEGDSADMCAGNFLLLTFINLILNAIYILFLFLSISTINEWKTPHIIIFVFMLSKTVCHYSILLFIITTQLDRFLSDIRF